MAKPRILIADDEPPILSLLRRTLASEQWDIETAQDGAEALTLLSKRKFALLILDLVMPHLSGIEVLQAIKERGIQTDVLVLTGHGTIETAVQAMKLGAKEFITKPFNVADMKHAVGSLLEKYAPSRRSLADRLDAFVSVHAFDPALKVDALCEHFKISPRYVAKLFQEKIGMPFSRRVGLYRIERAKALLQFTDDPLYRIAEQCGFRDYRRLTKTFRRLEQMSPREYRVMCRDSRT